MVALVFGLFGLIVGSFLNVVILRFGERSIRGRSACPICKMQLRWFDMVPVFSWFLLHGKCRYCRAPISIQYPLVEATTGVLFVGVGAAGLPFISTLIALAIVAVLVCIFVYDLQHTIIPDAWVWPFCILALVFAFSSTSYQLPATSYLLPGPAAASILFALWLLSRGRWMGFGDVKLALGIGWLLGFPYGLVAVFFAFILGAVVSVPILVWGKLRPSGGGGLTQSLTLASLRFRLGMQRQQVDVHASSTFGRSPHGAAKSNANVSAGLTMKSEVPFGPFLIASTFIVWFSLLYQVPVPIFSGI